MTLVDPKPVKRIRDKGVWRRFHDSKPRCLGCNDHFRVQAHHLISRAQRGDDVLANLVPLCWTCHGALHGQNDEDVRTRIAAYLRSEEGEKSSAYLISRLGPFGAEDYVQRLERA